MKQLLHSILYTILLIAFADCEQYEATPRAFPRLKTLAVTDLTNEGVTLNAAILFRGDFEIVRYGFTWGRINLPDVNANDRVVYSGTPAENKFSERISTTLIRDANYSVRAFVETPDLIVYGEPVRFKSLGSRAVEIGGFSPTSGILGDTITIQGNRFSFVGKHNTVRFGDVVSEVVAASDSFLQVIVPLELKEQEVSLSVELAGRSAVAEKRFTLVAPTILEMKPTTVAYCDEVHFSVANFPSDRNIIVLFLDQVVPARQVSPTEVVANVPAFISNKGKIIPQLLIRQFTLSADQDLTIMPPTVAPQVDSFLNYHDTLTIHHTHLNNCSIEVTCENVTAPLIEQGENFTKVQVPAEIDALRGIPVKISVQGEVLFNDRFDKTIAVNSVSPSRARAGEIVRIEGVGFQPILNRNSVYLAKIPYCGLDEDCATEVEVIESSSRHLLFKVPENIKNFTNADNQVEIRVFTVNYGTNGGLLEILP
ncbi:MAG: IPT/TIG domain-containing protein [Bacteroidota bacterium]